MSAIGEIRDAAQHALQVEIKDLAPVSGGDINDAYALELSDGRQLFLKTSPQAHAGSFTTEAAGLRWIAEASDGPLVPVVEALIDLDARAEQRRLPRMLILEWVQTGALTSDGSERLGRQLAAMHRAGAPAHGSPPPSVLGTEQSMFVGQVRLPTNSDPGMSWPDVYANLRVLPLARMAEARRALPLGALRLIELVCERLPQLAGPDEPPSRLHGDLWGGNVIADTVGVPYLVDPAAYGGHREVDLAMLRLFGGPSERCFAAYGEAYPLSDGHAERVGLWQLFPVLLHAALFGGGYGVRAAEIAQRYL